VKLFQTPPPPGLIDDLRGVEPLSQEAKTAFWNLLCIALEESPPPSLGGRAESFAAAFSVPLPAVVNALKAWRFVLRSAFTIDIAEAAFTEELSALSGSRQWLTDFVATGYGGAMTLLREEATRLTMFDHGRVLTEVDWRIQSIARSHRGPVVATFGVVTLQLQNAGATERVTFQATGAELVKLRDAIDAMLDTKR
jgi:hypothetical protein